MNLFGGLVELWGVWWLPIVLLLWWAAVRWRGSQPPAPSLSVLRRKARIQQSVLDAQLRLQRISQALPGKNQDEAAIDALLRELSRQGER